MAYVEVTPPSVAVAVAIAMELLMGAACWWACGNTLAPC